MDKDVDVRMLANDRSGCACVIEMDMRQQDVTNVSPSDAVRLQSQLERLKTAGWTGVDDRDAAMPMHERCCDDLWSPTKLKIDP
jgi:hypothetical protein